MYYTICMIHVKNEINCYKQLNYSNWLYSYHDNYAMYN